MFYAKKKILIAGGTGFVGSHFVEALLNSGAELIVPIHQHPLPFKHNEIKTIPADLLNLEDCLNLTKDVDFVIHAAGAVSGAGLGPMMAMDLIRQNMMFTINLLQSAWQNGVSRFLLFSSSTGYPEFTHPVVEEDFWKEDLHPAYLGYGWMRRYFEKLVDFVGRDSQLQIALVRPGATYGRRDNFSETSSHVIPALIKRACQGEDPFVVWGTGNEIRDFLHVKDLVQGALLVLEHHATSEAINIASGQELSVSRLVELVLKSCEHNVNIIYDHNKPVRIPIRRINIDKAKTLLGFRPQVDITEGIDDLVFWYLKAQENEIQGG